MASSERPPAARVVTMLAALGLCVLLTSTMRSQEEIPDEAAVPAELREHIEDRFRSPRMRGAVAEAFASVSGSSVVQRRAAILFLLDLGDEDVIRWLLLATGQRDLTLDVLADRGATRREIIPIARSMAELAWPAGVIKPVGGDADDPTGAIQRLAELFCGALGVADDRPSTSSDGYYHRPEVRGWSTLLLDRAVADAARPAASRSWLRYCRGVLGE